MSLNCSEDYYRDIFDCLSDALFVMDPRTGQIIDVNRTMLTMYGYRIEEVRGSTIVQYSSGIKPYRQVDALAKIKRAKNEGPQTFDWEARRKDGSLFWVEVSLRFTTGGGTSRLLAVVRDISERRRSQKLSAQNEKLIAVSGLAAGMAHEINNPLAGILQTVNVMADRLEEKALRSEGSVRAAEQAGTSIDSIQEFMHLRGIPGMIEAINASGRKLSGIVSRILSFSWKIDNAAELCDIRIILEKAISTVLTEQKPRTASSNDIVIERDFGNHPLYIPCDSNNLQQAFQSILRNSLEAFGNSEHPIPEISIHIGEETDGESLLISIRDNGPGISDDIGSRVFDPFFTTKPVGSGTGLGLSTAHFIICENHGGSIRMVPNPAGAEFEIKLPLHP